MRENQCDDANIFGQHAMSTQLGHPAEHSKRPPDVIYSPLEPLGLRFSEFLASSEVLRSPQASPTYKFEPHPPPLLQSFVSDIRFLKLRELSSPRSSFSGSFRLNAPQRPSTPVGSVITAGTLQTPRESVLPCDSVDATSLLQIQAANLSWDGNEATSVGHDVSVSHSLSSSKAGWLGRLFCCGEAEVWFFVLTHLLGSSLSVKEFSFYQNSSNDQRMTLLDKGWVFPKAVAIF